MTGQIDAKSQDDDDRECAGEGVEGRMGEGGGGPPHFANLFSRGGVKSFGRREPSIT